MPRYHLGLGLAVEPVREHTYRWVNPVDGKHEGYVVAVHVEYEPTIEAQIARSKRQ